MEDTVSSVLRHVRGSIWHWGSAPKYDEDTNSPILIGGRPVLIMSNNEYNRTHDKINALAFTSKYHGQKLPIFLQSLSYLMIDSWKDIPKADLTVFLGIAPPEYMISVEDELMKHLAIVLKTTADVTIKQLTAYINKTLEDAVNKSPVFKASELSAYIIQSIDTKLKDYLQPNRLNVFIDVCDEELKAQNPRRRQVDTPPALVSVSPVRIPAVSELPAVPAWTPEPEPQGTSIAIPKSFYNHSAQQRYSLKEKKFILDHYCNKNVINELMRVTGQPFRSFQLIYYAARKKDKTLSTRYHKWTDDEKLFIIEHYQTDKEMLMEKYKFTKTQLDNYYYRFVRAAGGK